MTPPRSIDDLLRKAQELVQANRLPDAAWTLRKAVAEGGDDPRIDLLTARVAAATDQALAGYRFNDAATGLYRFVWNDFCDWYVELSKHRLTGDDEPSAMDARATLARVLRDTLGLLHPFTPYITEKLWEALHETLGEAPEAMLAVAPWPSGDGLSVDEGAEAEMQAVQDLVGCVRQVRALTMVAERRPLPVIANVTRDDLREILDRHRDAIQSLAFLESLTLDTSAPRPEASAVAVAGGIEAYVLLGEDVDFAKLKTVLEGRAAKAGKALMGAQKKLENPGFLDYRIPVASDLPFIDTVIVEVPNPLHPFGVKGVGEVPISIVSDPDDHHCFDHTIRALGRVTDGLAAAVVVAQPGSRGPRARPPADHSPRRVAIYRLGAHQCRLQALELHSS